LGNEDWKEEGQWGLLPFLLPISLLPFNQLSGLYFTSSFQSPLLSVMPLGCSQYPPADILGPHHLATTNIHRNITHTHISWVHNFITETARCGTGHKYTNIHNFYSVKYYKNFTKQYYRLSLHKKFIYRVKAVCTYVFSSCCFELYLVVLEICQTKWYIVENFCISIRCTFLKQERSVFDFEDGSYLWY
jgi:hypothetical protein